VSRVKLDGGEDGFSGSGGRGNNVGSIGGSEGSGSGVGGSGGNSGDGSSSGVGGSGDNSVGEETVVVGGDDVGGVGGRKDGLGGESRVGKRSNNGSASSVDGNGGNGEVVTGHTESIGISDVVSSVDSGLIDIAVASRDNTGLGVSGLLSGRVDVGVSESMVSKLISGTVLGAGHGGNSDLGGLDGNSGGSLDSDSGSSLDNRSDRGSLDNRGSIDNGGSGSISKTVGVVGSSDGTIGGIGSNTSGIAIASSQRQTSLSSAGSQQGRHDNKSSHCVDSFALLNGVPCTLR